MRVALQIAATSEPPVWTALDPGELEGQSLSEVLRTADAREGVEAFLAKRAARFRGA